MAETNPIRDGRNDPAPTSRVLILGYSDGATDGVIEFGPGGPAYRFELVDEKYAPDGPDVRTYELRLLPPGSVERLAGIIGQHIQPKWPAWSPVWRFPTPDIQRVVEDETDAVLAAAGPVEWRLTTDDTVRFGRFTAERAGAARVRSAGSSL